MSISFWLSFQFVFGFPYRRGINGHNARLPRLLDQVLGRYIDYNITQIVTVIVYLRDSSNIIQPFYVNLFTLREIDKSLL